MDVLKHFEHFLKQHRLIAKGDTVVIGVSGGSDSMALLHALRLIRNRWGLRLVAGHVNHKLRKSADRDERFVQNYCLKHHIPFLSRTVTINLTARRDSVEQKAREKRLNALLQITQREQPAVLALAHHQDDLAETVLMRIVRGSGLAGLQAMVPKRTFQGVPVIRPFLQIPKEELLAFCKDQNIPFRIDPTNRNEIFLRNRVRHELMPILKTYNPKISKSLATLAENSADDYAFLHTESSRHFTACRKRSSNSKSVTLSADKVKRLHPAIQKMVLRAAVEYLKGDLRRFEQKHFKDLQGLLSAKHGPCATIKLPCQMTAKKSSSSNLVIQLCDS